MKGYKIQDWEIFPESNLLSGNKVEHKLQPQQMHLLHLFLKNPHLTLSREQITKEIWGNILVNKDALSLLISNIRKLLGDDSLAPKYIETVSKKGYKFIQEPELINKIKFKRPRLKRAHLSAAVVILLPIILGISIKSGSSIQQDKKIFVEPNFIPFTFESGFEYGASFSPNGENIYYVNSNNLGTKSQIVKKNIKDSGGSVIKTLNNWCPMVIPSPDGTELAYLEQGTDFSEIKIISSTSGEEKTSIRGLPTKFYTVDWAKDGALYYGKKTSSDTLGIFRYNLKTHKETLIFSELRHYMRRSNIQVSPNSKYIAYSTVVPKEGHFIKIFDIDKGTSKTVAKDNYFSYCYQWNETSDALLYANSQKFSSYKEVTLEGKLKKEYLFGDTRGIYPIFNAQSKKMAIIKEVVQGNIKAIDSGSTKCKEIAELNSSFNDRSPSESFDKKYLSFVSDRTGTPEIWIHNKKTKENKRVTYLNDSTNNTLLRMANFVDGSNSEIIFETNIEGHIAGYKVNTNTGAVELVTLKDKDCYFPHMDTENNDVYFSTNDKLGYCIFKKNLITNNLEKIGRGYYSDVDSNKQVYGSGFNGTVISKITNGQSIPVVTDLDVSHYKLWQIVGNNLFYISLNKASRVRSIKKLNLSNLKTEVITDRLDNSYNSFFVNENEQIYISKIQNIIADYYMADFNIH